MQTDQGIKCCMQLFVIINTNSAVSSENVTVSLYWIRSEDALRTRAHSFISNYSAWLPFKGDNSVKIVFAPFWKVVYSKRKAFAPLGANAFLLEFTPFQKWNFVQESKRKPQNCRPCLKWRVGIQFKMQTEAKIRLRGYAGWYEYSVYSSSSKTRVHITWSTDIYSFFFFIVVVELKCRDVYAKCHIWNICLHSHGRITP